MSSRLVVNPVACDGHGICAELLPELVRLDEWGYPIIEGEDLPQSLMKHVRKALKACPNMALLVEKGGSAS